MEVLDKGHKYKVDCLDGDLEQIITFVKREGEGYPGNIGHYPGTNCQEILRVLIERSGYLFNQENSSETECIISSLKTALLLFEVRAARKHGRFLSCDNVEELVKGKTCKICRHIGCNHE